jgi:hypothetical protein
MNNTTCPNTYPPHPVPIYHRLIPLLLGAVLIGLSARAQVAPASREPRIVEAVDLERVWAGHRVGFCLLTQGDHQFAAYYDAERRMTVAGRRLGEERWTFAKLDSTLGWDSHNYVTLAVDRAGYLHVCGNMHVAPLVYFRSDKPFDAQSLRRVPAMTGDAETRVTYPQFFRTSEDVLLFMYRDGSSGNGRRLVNAYDETTHTWSRCLDTPLLDGTGRSMNAYPAGIQKGLDGFFHLVWMWRETPDCRSNLHLSYVRSRDLKHWETAGGKAVPLPITPDNLDVVVDPTPANSGMINVGFGVGFDPSRRAVIHYHNYDNNGNSQIYLARWEDDAWAIRQVSRWDYRWDFQGGGSIPVDLGAESIHVLADGRLVQSWSHAKHGSGTWVLDPATLQVTDTIKLPPRYPAELTRPQTKFPGIGVRWAFDLGEKPSRVEPDAQRPFGPGPPSNRGQDARDTRHYVLRWESLGSNRDRPRSGPLPEPTMLTLYSLTEAGEKE